MPASTDTTTTDNSLEIPATMDDITPEWLTAALRAGGRDGVVVSAATHSPLAHLKGMLSSLGVFDVEYAEGDGPASVVVKLPTDNEANLGVAVAFNCYERDARILRDVAPTTSDAWPEIYYADVNPPNDFVIVMEDLRDYRSGDQVVGCTVEEATLAIEPLGQFHAAFWGKVDDDRFDYVHYHYPSQHSDGIAAGAVAGWDTLIELFGDPVPDYLRNGKERYLAAVPAMQRWITEPPITLVHGDFRLDNMFFGETADHRPFVASDLQGCLRSKGVQDIAFFLSQSLHVEDRRAHERDLVARWHQVLVDGGVSDYSAEQAWSDYGLAVLYMWAYLAIIGGTLDPLSDRGLGWVRVSVERASAAIDDLGLWDRLSEFE